MIPLTVIDDDVTIDNAIDHITSLLFIWVREVFSNLSIKQAKEAKYKDKKNKVKSVDMKRQMMCGRSQV